MLRQRRALTQEQLAQDCGISQKYLSELERGEKAASLDTLVAIAHRGLGIGLAALMFDVDDQPSTAVSSVEELLVGRSATSQRMILQGIALLLEAGAGAGAGVIPSTKRLSSLAAEPRNRRGGA